MAVASKVGDNETAFEAWGKLLLNEVDGFAVTHADILAAIRVLIGNKWEDASTGTRLGVPMLPNLLQSPLILSAIVAIKRSPAA